MAPTTRPRSLRCRLGFHAWVIRRNDAGERYEECQRCGEVGTDMPQGLGWQRPPD